MGAPLVTDTAALRPIFEGAADLCKRGWTQRMAARDAEGKPVNWQHASAVCFCMLGSTWRARLDLGLPPEYDVKVEDVLMAVIGRQEGDDPEYDVFWIGEWNDHERRKQEDAVAVLREAAAAC